MMPPVPSGSYRLAEQIGAWAIYADITVSVVVRGADDPFVALEAIGLGAAYALGFVRNSDDVGIVVCRLDTNPVDTTPLALAFATCHAVFKCFQISPPAGPQFDRSTKSFVFPARGKIDW